MGIRGPATMDSEAAGSAAITTTRELAVKIRADLAAAQFDGELDRPVLGWVECLITLLEHMGFHAFCGKEDAREWKQQYLAWIDTNYDRLPKRHRKKMRDNGERMFDRLIKKSRSGANLKNGWWSDVWGYAPIKEPPSPPTPTPKPAKPRRDGLRLQYRLFAYDEVEGYGLAVELADEDSQYWFIEAGHDGTGYSIHGLVYSIARTHLPAIVDKLRFSPEADNLLVSCPARWPLERLRACINKVLRDEKALQQAMQSVDPNMD